MELIIAPAGNKYYSVNVDASVSDPINMFQKASTVITIQDAKTYGVKKTQDLINGPL